MAIQDIIRKVEQPYPSESNISEIGLNLLRATTIQEQRELLDFFVVSPNYSTLINISGNIERVYITSNDRKVYAWNNTTNSYFELSPTPTGELDNRYIQNYGNTSGIQVMSTGNYNAITPLSGVVYILI